MKSIKLLLTWLDTRPIVLYLGVLLLFAVMRLSLLPLIPIGVPDDHDELSNVLQAETFALGRLSNPSPDHFQHFESFHIIQEPTYASKYPPGQAVFLFLGIKFLGHPWYGVLISCMLMTASIVWMIRGYTSTGWALTGGLLVIVIFAGWNYWSSSYWGGAVAATGGALLFGALPRLKSQHGTRLVQASIGFGLGLLLLSQTRPLEGLILATIPIIYFARNLWSRFREGNVGQSVRLCLPATLLLVFAISFTTYYNYRITGDPFKLPYVLHGEQYGVQAPVFLLDNKEPPDYNHSIFTKYYTEWEVIPIGSIRNYIWLKTQHFKKFNKYFFLWPLALIALLLNYSKPLKIPYWSFILCCSSFLIYPWFHPHYFAPAVPIYFLLIIIGIKYLMNIKWIPLAQPAYVLAPILIALTVFNTYGFNKAYPGYINIKEGYATRKQHIVNHLNQTDHQHLVFVSYTDNHPFHEEWVYNQPDLERSKIIWARYMTEAENNSLCEAYQDRKIWILQPDDQQVQLKEYNPNHE